MADIEKVVKGIECCMRVVCPINNDCPYYRTSDSKRTCREHLVADALELLKEQQGKILMMNMVYGSDCKVVGELVRCKDCKFGEACKNGRGEHGVWCYNTQSANKDWVHEPDWFCADGER